MWSRIIRRIIINGKKVEFSHITSGHVKCYEQDNIGMYACRT